MNAAVMLSLPKHLGFFSVRVGISFAALRMTTRTGM